jgi:hypothetical protein
MELNVNLRMWMERGEAAMWEKLLTIENGDEYEKLKLHQAYAFETLSRVQRCGDFVLSGTCEVCDDRARFRCGDCGLSIYCGEEHQKAHWVEGHREFCKAFKSEGIRNAVPVDHSIYAGKCSQRSRERPYMVCVLTRSAGIVDVFMSKDDMINYDKFCAAVKSVDPDALGDRAWQHWETVRGAWKREI